LSKLSRPDTVGAAAEDVLDEVVITAARPRELSPGTVMAAAWLLLAVLLVLNLRK
jgi:hypothetical protein